MDSHTKEKTEEKHMHKYVPVMPSLWVMSGCLNLGILTNQHVRALEREGNGILSYIK